MAAGARVVETGFRDMAASVTWSTPMRIVTWNVNSVRARLDRVVTWLKAHQPDALCLQELKVTDDVFPFDAIREAGYEAAVHGQKTYNGVAILAKTAPADVMRGLGDATLDEQARFICATVDGVRVASAYFPNGGEVDGPRYPYKLAWMRGVRAWLDANVNPHEAFALTGDFNVALDDLDVAEPAYWKDSVLTHDDVREATAEIAVFGLEDVFRKHHPDGRIYSWWDYRDMAFPKNNGLRIDHVFATAPLAARSTAAWVDRDERSGKGASDHAPVVVEFG